MLFVFYDSEKEAYGYRDEQGKTVIEPQYEQAERFHKGLAEVQQGGQWGIIDAEGKAILPCSYDSVISLNGWIQAQSETSYFLFKANGELVLEIEDIQRLHFPERELIRIKKATGWGAIDLKGQEYIPCRFKSLGPPMANGWLSFYDNGLWGWLGRDGEVQVPAQFAEVGIWDQRYWWALSNGRYSLYDMSGRLFCDAGWHKILAPKDGMAAVKTEAGWQFINDDLTCTLQLPPHYDWVDYFSEGYAAVKSNEAWGYVDEHGREVIAPMFERASPFHEGLAAVQQNGLWGYLDQQGTLVIACQFHTAGPFHEGKARVADVWDTWLIDTRGEPVSERESVDHF